MSKECRKYSVDLSAYFDGELEEKEAAELKTHLRGCKGCSDSLERLRSLHNALTSLNRPALGGRSVLEDLKARLHLDDAPEDAPPPKRPN